MSNILVFFDNLQVTHIKGPILEETHYYPFGLTMAGISSKAAGGLENKRKYNGIEFENDLEIQTYDAFYRELDPQIARWWQIDPVTDGYESISPYASMYDNPITFSDPLGNEGEACCKVLWSIAGGAAAVLDNAFAINLRSTLAPSSSDPEAVEAYNHGQNGGDIASLIIGTSETLTGAGITAGGGVFATTGGGAVPGGATSVFGLGVSAHGLFTVNRASNSLATQKGRVQVNSGSSSGKGTQNPKVKEAVDKGNAAHKDFSKKADAKGWTVTPTLKDPKTGKTVKPDAVTKSGKPVELKPNTPSGKAKGANQLPKYERATGQKGRVVTYDPNKY